MPLEINETKLDQVITDAELAMTILASVGAVINPAVPAAAALANRLLSALQAGVKAHEAILGQPLDLSLLHHIDPVV